MSDELIVAEVYLFDTCTHRCGYCWLAESGNVLDTTQLERFRDPAFIDRIVAFFNSRAPSASRWLLQFTGGEPLLTPNLNRLCDGLLAGENRLAFYTALLLDENHSGFRYLMSRSAPEIDYVMASFHPQSEEDEERQFTKFRKLKERGHNIIFRYVGHPARLHRLQHFEDRCREIDVCFFPTTLFSNRYPSAYTAAERQTLSRYFTSLSQHVQLEGGVDTTGVRCWAGSRLVAVNLQTGDITPCITVHAPVIGNVFRDELQLASGSIACPQQGISCACDVHFQQDIVIGADDSDRFAEQKRGFIDARRLSGPGHDALAEELTSRHLRFYKGTKIGIGDVIDDSRLTYTKEEVKLRWRQLQKRSAVPQVRVDLLPRSLASAGESLVAEIRRDDDAAISGVQGYVNEADDGTGSGAWRPLIVEQPWNGTLARFAVETATLSPGRHRIAVNLDLGGGRMVYWYEQPARICQIVGGVTSA